MSFRPLDAIAELDRKLTPGPIEWWHQTHFENVKQQAEVLPTPDLVAQIEQHKKGEPSRLFIAALTLVDVVGAAPLLITKYPEAAPLIGPAVLVAILVGPHRGRIKLRDREIMEEELNRRRPSDAMG